MFTYCGNCPSSNFDIAGERPVGVGVQLDLSSGGETVGVEIVIYFDDQVCSGSNAVVVCYFYSGAEASAESLMTVQSVTNALNVFTTLELGNMTQDAILFLGKTLLEGLDVSGSFFYIDGYDNFKNTSDYSGSFETLSFSGTFNGMNAGMYYSYCDTCFAVGIKVGLSTPKPHLLPVDFSYSRTDYSQPHELMRW